MDFEIKLLILVAVCGAVSATGLYVAVTKLADKKWAKLPIVYWHAFNTGFFTMTGVIAVLAIIPLSVKHLPTLFN